MSQLNISSFSSTKTMERSKQIQTGLLAVIALLLMANLFGGGFQNWFGKSGKAGMEAAAAGVSSQDYNGGGVAAQGNIPGTNVADATAAPIGPTTSIQYENDKFNFGVTNEGEIVKHVFKLKTLVRNRSLSAMQKLLAVARCQPGRKNPFRQEAMAKSLWNSIPKANLAHRASVLL